MPARDFALAPFVEPIKQWGCNVVVEIRNTRADDRQHRELGEPAISRDILPDCDKGIKTCENTIVLFYMQFLCRGIGVDAPCGGIVLKTFKRQGQVTGAGELVVMPYFAAADRAGVIVEDAGFCHNLQIVCRTGTPRGCDIKIIENALTDRGSKYAVSGGPAASAEEARDFIKALTRDKKFAKATHNTWGLLLPDGTPLKNDDGETGAGMVIVRMLERAEIQCEIIVVTRWFGGTKLGGDRFRRVQDAVRVYLDDRG